MRILENGTRPEKPMMAKARSWRGGHGDITATMCEPLPGVPSLYGVAKAVAVIPSEEDDKTKYGREIRNVLAWLFRRNIPAGPVAVLYEDQDGTGDRIFVEMSAEPETDGRLLAWPEKAIGIEHPKAGDPVLRDLVSAMYDFAKETRQ